MKTIKLLPPVFAAALFSMTGCMHYTLRPDAPFVMPKSEAPPLPLRVGLSIDEQSLPADPMSKQMLNSKRLTFGPRFAEVLRGSRLFRDVKYPLPLTRSAMAGVDLVISGQFGYEFVQDPMQGPKIVLVCFTGFITGAILSETSHHIAKGVFSVADAAGNELKNYDETIDVTAKSMVSMFAELKTMTKGPPAALDNLAAKLVENLIADRTIFERVAGVASSAPAEPRPVQAAASAPAPAASGGQPWWRQDEAKDDSGRTGAAPQPSAKPDKSLDSQLLP
ncbi:MAG: hypothetical protein PHF00_08020 [Elusimicrobia bacterium]|nr:hypothetical protein [Elusimicrobiota bacterium]